MEPESEFFDAFENTDDIFANLNFNNSENISRESGVTINPAVNPDELFLNQMPADHFNEMIFEDKDRSSPLLLDEEIDPIMNDDLNNGVDYIKNAEERSVMDDAFIAELQARFTDEDKQACREESKALKTKGNLVFKDEGDYSKAESLYTDALKKCLISDKEDRAILFSNRAACRIQQKQYEPAIEDCSKAIEFNPTFIRALLRRADAYEKTEKLEEALADYQKILDLDPTVHQARSACLRLPDQIKVRNEQLKDEMIGKLKDLGNLVLRPFGLSTDNFKVQQDPSTGSYSINFQQNARQ